MSYKKSYEGYWKGKKIPDEIRRKISKTKKGQYLSKETCYKISLALKGRESPMKNKHHSEKTRKNMSLSRQAYVVNKIKGKTYEEIYGIEKAKIMKENLSISHKGYKMPEKQRKKISESNKGKKRTASAIKATAEKNRGKKRSKETIKKLSLSHLGYKWRDEDRAKLSYNAKINPNYGMRGKHHTEESNNKNSLSNKKLYADGYIHPMQGRHHTIEARQKIIDKRRFQVIPVKDTSIEVKLQNELENKNIVFSTHKPIFGLPDIFIEPNFCIFADGDYWHKYPNGTEHDKHVNEVLEKHGYKILRFWEKDINNNIGNCVNKILEEINANKN